jgi:hypothetical protein
MDVRTKVEILNRDLEKIAEVRALYPLNEQGMILRYSRELSDYGFCTFRIVTSDPIFEEFGDIFVPHQYHVRIKRGETTVWQGGIVDNPVRNKLYIEVKAAEYDFYLDKILIKRTSQVGYGEPASNIPGLHYRIFDSGTMASAVNSIVTEAKDAAGTNHILADLTIGTIDNPDYPNNFTTADGASITGAWNFSSDVVLQFDYQSVLYAIKAFGIYTNADFEITPSLEFNFRSFLGVKQPSMTFEYGTRGNIVDYNVPRYGSRMVNDYFGIAASPEGNILHNEKKDQASIDQYGLMQSGKSFADVKDSNALNARLSEELFLVKTPEDSPINLILDEKAYPLGQFDLGDLVTVKIVDGIIDYYGVKRVVGITVNVHNTGRELITVQTNNPRPNQLGA